MTHESTDTYMLKRVSCFPAVRERTVRFDRTTSKLWGDGEATRSKQDSMPAFLNEEAAPLGFEQNAVEADCFPDTKKRFDSRGYSVQHNPIAKSLVNKTVAYISKDLSRLKQSLAGINRRLTNEQNDAQVEEARDVLQNLEQAIQDIVDTVRRFLTKPQQAQDQREGHEHDPPPTSQELLNALDQTVIDAIKHRNEEDIVGQRPAENIGEPSHLEDLHHHLTFLLAEQDDDAPTFHTKLHELVQSCPNIDHTLMRLAVMLPALYDWFLFMKSCAGAFERSARQLLEAWPQGFSAEMANKLEDNLIKPLQELFNMLLDSSTEANAAPCVAKLKDLCMSLQRDPFRSTHHHLNWMPEYWHGVARLSSPSLVLHVIGSTDAFLQLEPLHSEVRDSLQAIASHTNAWVVTDGSRQGIVQCMSRALKDIGLSKTPARPFILSIGPARENDDRDEADAHIKTCYNHSFRSSFVQEAAKHLKCHSVAVVIRGDKAALNDALAASKILSRVALVLTLLTSLTIPGPPMRSDVAGVPVVVVKDSGGMAKVLGYAYHLLHSSQWRHRDHTMPLHMQCVEYLLTSGDVQMIVYKLDNQASWNLVNCVYQAICQNPSQTSSNYDNLLTLAMQLKISKLPKTTSLAVEQIRRSSPAFRFVMHRAIRLNSAAYVQLCIDRGVLFHLKNRQTVFHEKQSPHQEFPKQYCKNEQMTSINTRENSAELEAKAIELLKECKKQDVTKTRKLLEKEWESNNVLEMAYKTDSNKFLAKDPCQRFVTEQWYGDMSNDNSVPKIALCVAFLSLPVILLEPSQSRKLHVQANNNDDDKSSNRNTGLCHKLGVFWTAPFVRLWMELFAHLVLCCLFSFYLLDELPDHLSRVEIALMVWFANLIVEEIHQLQYHLRKEWGYFWTRQSCWGPHAVEMIFFSLYIAGLVTRLSDFHDSGTKRATKAIHAFVGIMLWLRTLGFLKVCPRLGPKIAVLLHMRDDILIYLALLVSVLVGFGVAFQAVLYPLTSYRTQKVIDVLFRPYFQIYGDQILEHLSDEASCQGPQLFESCPTQEVQMLPFLLALFVLGTTILLVNMLIGLLREYKKPIRTYFAPLAIVSVALKFLAKAFDIDRRYNEIAGELDAILEERSMREDRELWYFERSAKHALQEQSPAFSGLVAQAANANNDLRPSRAQTLPEKWAGAYQRLQSLFLCFGSPSYVVVSDVHFEDDCAFARLLKRTGVAGDRSACSRAKKVVSNIWRVLPTSSLSMVAVDLVAVPPAHYDCA
ncbi:hypothetical protein PTSG_09163 [Salpingoeca rosetta]|uniref:TRPM SLOG domain-containing protein n=1 Tax=Salpingoeca rosetta (strain ATCC 50818 / BSB-021) TaxID=946362 RepID=F2UMW9_SALR5|nr:uncharacterized protein PTSG_09163 [Salpingoeca rosetta]EGD78468.1 hypothetical protein PTSG_09163 [Salpingoeca rosetta]|eukprot:XP_004989417.1 hypothetical protein PTSG_09163 [Salpingoeca rosetta]